LLNGFGRILDDIVPNRTGDKVLRHSLEEGLEKGKPEE
jgi:hypothetical protein